MEKLKLSVNTTRRERIFGCAYLALMLLALPRLIGLLLPRADNTTRNFVFFCLNFCAVIAIFHRFLASSLRLTLSHPGRLFFPVLFGLAGYHSLTILVSRIILYFLPGFSNINDSSIAALAGQNYVMWIIGSVILVPIVEETLFRGLVFGSVGKGGLFWGYLVSSLCFSAIHVMGYLGTASWQTLLACLVQYLPAGICLAWSYHQSGSIFAPILIHTIINAMAMASLR